MNKIITILTLALLSNLNLYTQRLNPFTSTIVSPAQGSTVHHATPVLAGIIRNAKGKQLKNKKVSLYLNNRKIGVVQSNNDGVWSYRLQPNQQLTNGSYVLQAFVELTPSNIQTALSILFQAQITTLAMNKISRSGNVSVANSEISFPQNSGRINITTPTIIGVLLNAQANPVANETVQVKIDGTTVGTVSSNSNGVFSYTLTTEQALSETSYTVGAHCVETNVDLNTNSFTVDTTLPAAPVISAPTENQVLTSSLVTISGTTEANATITSFMDSDTFGDVSYADASGNWSIEYELTNDNHSVTAQAEDLAYNTGPLSAARNFSVNA